MFPRSLIALWLVPIVLAVLASAAPTDQAPWLGQEWSVRRVVDIKSESSRQPGAEVGVCTFFCGGLVKPDGSDVRVTVKGRQLTPHRVLQVGPGDLVRVAFAAVPGETRYYVYHGNPKADAPAAWEPQRGVLLEVRRWTGGPPDKLDQVKAAWTKATPLGGDFVSHVSFGFNPFAESETPAIYHFTGWFLPAQPGAYSIATSSNGGSWVLIDGQEVVAWPGAHGPLGDARHAKSVTLTLVPHRLDYWNVNHAGTVQVVAAWEVPQSGHFEPIPAKAFLPVAEGTLIETDMPAEKLVADFFADNAGEAWWPDQYAVRMRFKNLSKNLDLQKGKVEWDFGDGQTSTLFSPTHIYLASGDYTVALKVSRQADSSTFHTKVHVDRNWAKQTEGAIELAKKYADEVALYNFAKLDVRSLIYAVSLLEHEAMTAPLVLACAELLNRPELKELQIHKYGLLLGEYQVKGTQAQQAVATYRKIEERLKAPPLRAELAYHAADTLQHDLHRYDEAEKEYQRLLKSYATSGADAMLRRAHIGMGDVWRHRGDGDKARQEYHAASSIKVINYPPNEAAVRVGTLARYVEEYTRDKQWEWAFKFLDDWAWEFPEDKLTGNWSFLRASALQVQGEKQEALLEAMDLLGANPESPYAVRLLMLGAKIQVALGNRDKAKLLLQSAVEDYPEDPNQAEARKQMMALEGAGVTTPPASTTAPTPAAKPAPGPATPPGKVRRKLQ